MVLQITLCDPIWHVSSCSCEAVANCYTWLLLLLPLHPQTGSWQQKCQHDKPASDIHSYNKLETSEIHTTYYLLAVASRFVWHNLVPVLGTSCQLQWSNWVAATLARFLVWTLARRRSAARYNTTPSHASSTVHIHTVPATNGVGGGIWPPSSYGCTTNGVGNITPTASMGAPPLTSLYMSL